MAKTKTKKNTKEEKEEVKTHPLILGARITEKSALSADKNQYTFNVDNNANKNEIKKAIKTLYKVTPVKVSIVKVSGKKVMRGGVSGFKSGGKKAVVHLKKGDKIEFV